MSIWITALPVLAVGLGAHYLRTAARKPELVYQANPENQALIAQVPRLTRRFWATPWLFNGHLQLLGLGLKKAFAPRLAYDRVDTLRMADGGTTALHWLGAELPAEVPTLVVLHTITGSPTACAASCGPAAAHRLARGVLRAPWPRPAAADQPALQHHG